LNALLPNATSNFDNLNQGFNYNTLFPGTYNVNGYDGRFDHSFGSNHKVFFRVSNKQVTNAGANGSSYDTILGTYTTAGDLANYVGSYNWIVRPNLVNEFRVGYTKSDYSFGYPFASQGDALVSSLGIKGLPGPPVNGLGGVPALYFPSLFG